MGKIDEESERIAKKLGNESFREKAPPEVIAKNETQFNELKTKRDKLLASKKVLENLSG